MRIEWQSIFYHLSTYDNYTRFSAHISSKANRTKLAFWAHRIASTCPKSVIKLLENGQFIR